VDLEIEAPSTSVLEDLAPTPTKDLTPALTEDPAPSPTEDLVPALDLTAPLSGALVSATPAEKDSVEEDLTLVAVLTVPKPLKKIPLEDLALPMENQG
jgi:hypothetical protein